MPNDINDDAPRTPLIKGVERGQHQISVYAALAEFRMRELAADAPARVYSLWMQLLVDIMFLNHEVTVANWATVTSELLLRRPPALPH